MMIYKVFYSRFLLRDLHNFRFVPGRTHAFIVEVEADNLGEAYTRMQGLNWSPRGEARPVIRRAGVSHTSMSVGDVLLDDQGNAWVCARLGWTLYDD